VADRFEGAEPPRPEFLAEYAGLLRATLAGAPHPDFLMAPAVAEESMYLAIGEWYWVLGFAAPDRSEVRWVSNDYFVYRNLSIHFDLTGGRAERLQVMENPARVPPRRGRTPIHRKLERSPLESSYDRLRPWTDIESCECEEVVGILLVDILTDNPLHCSVCRREVDPERLVLTNEETEAIAHWFDAASALYRLWLHSGEYESYAKARLIDPDGQINRNGRTIAEELSTRIPTQLWIFHDTDDGEPEACPVCGADLDRNVSWGTGQCGECRIRM
jgi:hypothetical protein